MSFKTFLALLELTGIVVAFLDFTGCSKSLQAVIDAKRFRLFEWLKNKHHITLAGRYTTYVALPTFGLFAVSGLFFLTSSQYTGVVFAVWLLIGVVPWVVLGVLLPLAYNFLLWINKPAAGTVGTISLTISLASFFLQRTDQLKKAPDVIGRAVGWLSGP